MDFILRNFKWLMLLSGVLIVTAFIINKQPSDHQPY